MRSRAKLTTRMLLAVATPMHMMAPVNAGTLKVVPVTNSIQTMPARAAGKRGDDDEGVEPGLEIDHDQQIHQQDRADHADGKTGEGGRMVSTWPRSTIAAARQRALERRDAARGCRSPTAPRSRSFAAP